MRSPPSSVSDLGLDEHPERLIFTMLDKEMVFAGSWGTGLQRFLAHLKTLQRHMQERKAKPALLSNISEAAFLGFSFSTFRSAESSQKPGRAMKW